MSASVTVEVAVVRFVVVIGLADSGAEHFHEGERSGGAVGPGLELAGVSARQNPHGEHGQFRSRCRSGRPARIRDRDRVDDQGTTAVATQKEKARRGRRPG